MPEVKSSPTLIINELSPVKRFVVWLLSLVVRLWQRTLRFEFDAADMAKIQSKGEEAILLLWHNQLFSTIELQRRFRQNANPLYALVSASKDGAFLSALLQFLGMKTVRGSSSRRGAQAAKDLLRVLKTGGDVGITVDGPRGPIYKAQPGGAMLAILSRKPVHFVVCNSRNHWRLKSWDRFYLPVPFSKVEIKLKSFDSFEAFGVGRDREAVQAFVEVKLNELHDDHF